MQALDGLHAAMTQVDTEKIGSLLADNLQRPPSAFILGYTQLPLYGEDQQHPRLEPNTATALQRLKNGCG